MPTLLEINILMHYVARCDDYHDGSSTLDAPAVRGAVNNFVERGLLAHSDPAFDFEGRRYMPTDGARMYVEALKAVPLPLRAWTMPSADSMDRED